MIAYMFLIAFSTLIDICFLHFIRKPKEKMEYLTLCALEPNSVYNAQIQNSTFFCNESGM